MIKTYANALKESNNENQNYVANNQSFTANNAIKNNILIRRPKDIILSDETISCFHAKAMELQITYPITDWKTINTKAMNIL